MRNVSDFQNEYGLINDIRVETANVRPHHHIHKDAIEALWQRFGDNRFSRSDFSPTVVPPKTLPHTSLLDIRWAESKDGDNDYRYRVIGTEHESIIGVPLSGKGIKDYPKRSCRTYLMRLHDECAHQGKPVFSSARIEYPGDIWVSTEKTFIPLYDKDSIRPNMILTIFTFAFQPYTPGYIETTLEPTSAHEQFKVFEKLSHLHITAQREEVAKLRAV